VIKKVLMIAGIGAILSTGAYAKDTEFTVHHGPGGPSDQTTRLIANTIKSKTNQYNVVNRPGAAGKIAIRQMLKTKTSIITATMAQIYVTNTLMFDKLEYNPKNSFNLIGVVATMPNVLVCNNERKFFTVSDLEKYGKGKILFGAAGYGSSEHLATEVLRQKLTIKSTVIPYAKGGTTALTDLLAGNIDCMFANYPTVKNHIGEKITSIMSSHELGLDIPTWYDVYTEDFPFVSPIGLIASARTSRTDLRNIKQDINNTFKNPDFVKGLKDIGLFPVASTSISSRLKVLRNNDALRIYISRNNIPLKKD